MAIFFSRFEWLAHVSLWAKLGMDWMPSIGLTRAYWLVLHGDFVAAWHRNGLIYLVLLVGIPLLLKDIWQLVRKFHQKQPEGQLTVL
jgi:hypothetical protein